MRDCIGEETAQEAKAEVQEVLMVMTQILMRINHLKRKIVNQERRRKTDQERLMTTDMMANLEKETDRMSLNRNEKQN